MSILLFIPILYPLSFLLITIGGILSAKEILKKLAGKKALLLGLPGSGKTSFLKHMCKNPNEIPDGPSGNNKEYKVHNSVFKKVVDLGGGNEFIDRCLDTLIKETNYILIFFDINKYITNDNDYRDQTNARFYYTYKNNPNKKQVILIASHKDECKRIGYHKEIEELIITKPYKKLLENIVYVNTQKKECVTEILKKIKN